MWKKINALQKERQIKQIQTVPENAFLSPTVVFVKKDKTVEFALEYKKLRDSGIKGRP